MRARRALGRLLVRCVAEHDWSTPAPGVAGLLAGLDMDEVAAAARFHGVTGCVHHSLSGVVDARAAAALARDHRRGVDLHLRALGDLARLMPHLDELGGPWLVVKGPVLAETFYARPDLRSYSDLDLVVDGGSLERVLSAVERAGGRLISRNWALLRELRVGELLLRLHHGTLLDLHWHLVNDAGARRAFRVPTTELSGRARLVHLGPLQVPTLDPTDTLLHLGLHACVSGGDRLVWLKDVERAIATEVPTWDDLVRRARSWGVGPPVALTLVRARAVVGASVPDGVPEALAQGRTWLAMAAAAHRLAPPERSQGSRSLARMLSRSTRCDLASSAAELTRHLARAVTGAHRFSRTPPRPDMNPDSPASAHHAAGLPGDRQAFLDAVAAENS